MFEIVTHQFLVYTDDVKIPGGSVHGVKKNAETLVGASKESGLEVNADKTKCMVKSRIQNAGRSHITKPDEISFEMVEHF